MAISTNLLNPIALYTEQELQWYDEFSQTCFNQPFNFTDTTTLQLYSNNQISVSYAYLIDSKGRRVKDMTFTYPNSNITEKYLAEIALTFNGVIEGVYKLKIGLFDIEGGYVFISNTIHLAESHERSVLLRYRNTENTQNVIFHENLWFNMRIKGGLLPKSFKPNSDDTSYVNQNVDTLLLKSTPYDTFNFTAGGRTGIPDWLQSIINRAFSCDTIFIDNWSMIKADGANWQPTANSRADLRTWTIEMGFTKNVFSKEFQPTVLQAKWLNYICQRQSEPLAYIFAFAANDSNAYTHSSTFMGEIIDIDIISIRSSVFFPAPDYVNEVSWATVLSIIEIPEEAKMRVSVRIDINADSTRSGSIQFKQPGSGMIALLTLTQAAGSYPITIATHEPENVLNSVVHLTLDNAVIVTANFTGTNSKILYIPTARKVDSVRLLVDTDPTAIIEYANINVQAIPNLEIDTPIETLALPIDAHFTPIPALAVNGSDILNVYITPQLPETIGGIAFFYPIDSQTCLLTVQLDEPATSTGSIAVSYSLKNIAGEGGIEQTDSFFFSTGQDKVSVYVTLPAGFHHLPVAAWLSQGASGVLNSLRFEQKPLAAVWFSDSGDAMLFIQHEDAAPFGFLVERLEIPLVFIGSDDVTETTVTFSARLAPDQSVVATDIHHVADDVSFKTVDYSGVRYDGVAFEDTDKKHPVFFILA